MRFKCSDEEGLEAKLESRDGAEQLVEILPVGFRCVGVREGKRLGQMIQGTVGTGFHLILGWAILRCPGTAFRWRADREQRGSDGGSGIVKALPDATRSGVAHVAG